MEPLVIDWAKEEANSIFKSIMQYFLVRSIALKKCYLTMNFEKIHCTVFKMSVKMQI